MRKSWTEDENKHLTELVTKYGKQWSVIAQHMPNRTSSQVSSRWEKSLNPKLVKGPFSEEEDEIIREYVKNNGAQNWSALAALLPKRCPKQLRERWCNHLDPNVSSKSWDDQEDIQLVQYVTKFGSRWSYIAKFFPGRTDNSIKNRWNSSIRKRLINSPQGCILAPSIQGKKQNKQTQQPLAQPCSMPFSMPNQIPINPAPVNNSTIVINTMHVALPAPPIRQIPSNIVPNPPPVTQIPSNIVPNPPPVTQMQSNLLPNQQKSGSPAKEKETPYYQIVAQKHNLTVNTRVPPLNTLQHNSNQPVFEFNFQDVSPNPFFNQLSPNQMNSSEGTPNDITPSGQSRYSNMFK